MVVSAQNLCKILICDTDSNLLKEISDAFRKADFFTVTAHFVRQALDRMAAVQFDAVVVSERLPGIYGRHVTQHIRMLNGPVPIVAFGTAGNYKRNMGHCDEADEYLPYPFKLEDLVCAVSKRIVEVNRRSKEADCVYYSVGNLTLDDEKKLVEVDGAPIRMTPSEYSILHFLIKNAGKVYSAGEIYQAVWQQEPLDSNSVVTVHICHIREKIEKNPKKPVYLKVLWRRGYYIEPNPVLS